LVERRERLGDLLFGAQDAIGFSEAFEGDGAALFAQAEKMGLEGIVSKKATSAYRSGPSRLWLKTKCWTESELTLIGFDRDSAGVPIALLAREYAGVLVYAGAAFVGMPPEVREQVRELREIVRSPVSGTGRNTATWLEPTLRLKVRHLRGDEGSFLRHATVKGLADG
jgi:ATP-dependent DNA ligase